MCWDEVPGNLVAARSELVLRPARRLSRQRLRFLVASWDRWFEWLAEVGLQDQAYTPTATTVGLFLAASASRGSTASHSAFSAFKWYRRVIGIPFPVSEARLRDFGAPEEGHKPQPAMELQPGEFWNLIALARRLGSRGWGGL